MSTIDNVNETVKAQMDEWDSTLNGFDLELRHLTTTDEDDDLSSVADALESKASDFRNVGETALGIASHLDKCAEELGEIIEEQEAAAAAIKVAGERDDRFTTLDVTEEHLADLTGEIASSWRKQGRLVAIVDEQQGGIIAYAIGEDNAATLTTGLES